MTEPTTDGDGNTTTLQRFLEQLRPGNPISHGDLTLIPLLGPEDGRLDYLLGADAIKAGQLIVTEVSEGGSVPELLAFNDAEQMILLLDGEELVGAKQNRILNTNILLPAKTKIRIPVSCVEQGRWSHRSKSFDSGHYAPASMRAHTSRDVRRSLLHSGRAESDQAEVWREVAGQMHACEARSPSMAMSDIFEQKREPLSAYLKALNYPAGCRGVIAAVGGRFAAMDLFDKPSTLRRIWRRLVEGYAIDAIARRKVSGKPFTTKAAEVLLERLGEIPCNPCPTVGAGEDWRFEAEEIVGQALVAEGACVHLSAFPNGRNRPDD